MMYRNYYYIWRTQGQWKFLYYFFLLHRPGEVSSLLSTLLWSFLQLGTDKVLHLLTHCMPWVKLIFAASTVNHQCMLPINFNMVWLVLLPAQWLFAYVPYACVLYITIERYMSTYCLLLLCTIYTFSRVFRYSTFPWEDESSHTIHIHEPHIKVPVPRKRKKKRTIRCRHELSFTYLDLTSTNESIMWILSVIRFFIRFAILL